MKYVVLMVMGALAICIFRLGERESVGSAVFADPLTFPYFFAVSDTPTAPQTNANNNAMKNLINGNLANDNIKAGANISQNKIDSASGGWITDRTGYFTRGSQAYNLRSPYGVNFYINDSTTYDKEFRFVSDSTDSIMKMSNDSAWFYKPLKTTSTVLASGKIAGDSLISSKGARITNSATIGGYATIGAGAPTIAFKKLTGTTDASGDVNLYHGLTASKILQVSGVIDSASSGATFVAVSGGDYSSNPDAPIIIVGADSIYYDASGNADAYVKSAPIKLFITYEQ